MGWKILPTQIQIASFTLIQTRMREKREKPVSLAGWETTFSLQRRLSGPHQGSTQSVCQTKAEGSVGREWTCSS